MNRYYNKVVEHDHRNYTLKRFPKILFYVAYTTTQIVVLFSSILVPSIIAGMLLSLNFTMIYRWTFGRADNWVNMITLSRKINGRITFAIVVALF